MDAAMEDRDSATYSIESEPSQPTSGKNISIDDVILPTVRRSAIQIVSQPISPRRQLKKPSTASATGTMQITKLVLKTPPGSPKRQPKVPGIIIRSIQTVGGPGLIGCVDHQDHGTVKQKPSVLMDNGQNVHDETVPYRIVPIVDPKSTSIRKDFEARRAERERSSNEFQDFLRESFKENKTPPSTPPPPPALATSKAVEITHNSAMTSSASESKSHGHNVTKSSCVKPGPLEVIPQINPPAKEDQSAQQPLNVPIVSPPVPAARRSLLVATETPPDVVQKPATLALAQISKEPVISMPPPLPENIESQANVEPMEPLRKSAPIRQKKQPVKPTAVPEPPKKKEKSYDPARAREFIREQQAKRRQEKKETPATAAGSSTKAAPEKDLIKQRLETLRQSSQKLVSKSVQKARTRSQSCAPKMEDSARKDPPIRTAPSEHQRTRPSTARPAVTNLRKFSSTPSLKLIKHPAADGTKHNNPLKPLNSASDSTVHAPRKPQRSIVNIPSGPASTSSDKLSSRVGSKIGILRKPDDLALEDIIPFSPLKRESLSQPSSVKLKPTQQGTSSSMVNAQLIVINAEKNDDQSIAEAEKELKLDVPNVSLVPSSTATQMPEKLPEAKPVEDHAPEPIKTIPSWLKQSLRQPDPYPFIVAVRKKLEAVRNVRDEEEDTKRTAEVQGKDTNVETPIRNAKSHAYLDAIESVPFIRKEEQPNNKATVPPRQRQSSDVVIDGSIIMTNISSYASSNTTSEISSIKSDIPPPMPPLLCSTRIEIPHQITIKSLSPRAASSGPISPLSVERISQMKIANPQPTASRLPRPIDREREAENSIQHGSRKNESLASPANDNRVAEPTDRSLKELEYQRLLESFNRSLTHVIEVNQQLYSALKKVPAPAAVPQEILRIRDEMTQTSQPVMVIPKEAVQDAQNRDQVSKIIDPAAARAGGSTTTASNYSDDFEHQSQTMDAPETPERKASLHSIGSPAISSTESSGSSSSSSSSDHGSSSESSGSRTSDNSSSSSTSSSSNESIGPHNTQSERHDQMADQANTTGERKKMRTASNTTTAHSSDFDSRSFSLSDSHNNTRNNHPPMPDEYLPSFEESLRRSKQASVSDELDKRNPRAQESSRDGTSIISERIDRTNEERSFSLRHTEEANDLPVKAASLPLATDTDDTSFDRSTLKGESGSKGQHTNATDTTINSELLAAMFNRTDLEVSILSATVSETNLSYSSIGMFDQMINGEKSREEQLVSRVQAKQKALLNRAKGQLAWLELQKQRYREKGMTEHISAIKKKQRAILLRLEKDRAELNRTIKNSTDSSATITVRTPLTAKNVDSKLSSYCSSPTGNTAGSLTLRKTSSSIRSGHRQPRTPETPHHQRQRREVAGSTVTATTTTTTSNSIQIAIRGRELEPNDRLEDILLRREAELRKRKEHVQRLLQWHRKLEREEEELLAVEGKLLAYNSRKLEENTTAPKPDDPTMEARVRSIERSLKTLQSIPASVSGGASVNGSIEHGDEGVEEVVKMGGSKLNRLWYRLTGIKEQRYEPGRNYPITRPHLEALYEQAKRCVLEGFQRNEGRLEEGLFEQSIGAGEVRSNSELGETNTTTMSAESAAGGSLSQHTMIESEKTVPSVEERKETPDGAVDMESQKISEPSEQEESNKTDPVELPGDNDDGGYMLLSSTVVNGWSPESRRSIESVEFHTLEETGTHSQSIPDATTSIEEEPPGRSESYSMTFEEHSVMGRSNDPDASDGPGLVVGEESQPMIEDMSLPLNNTSGWLNETEETASSSSCESSITVELSIPLVERKDGDEGSSAKNTKEELIASDGSDSIVQSLEEASDSTVATVTPISMSIEAIDENIPKVHEDNVDASDGKGNQKEGMGEMMISLVEQPTVEDMEDVGSDFEVEEEDIFQLRSSRVSSRTDSPSSCASELEKRLATLHDELEELSETFERTPLMKSPTMPKTKAERTTSTSEDETNTFVDEGSSVSGAKEKESSSSVAVVVADLTTTLTPVDPPSVVKMEVKVLPKASSSFADGSIGIASASAATSNRDYPAVPPHQGHTATAGEAPLSPPVVVRMPDIINEAEVLRRQQLQIEQEIKELEQQVGFFREIPNKPPPPYIPPANGSPLALLFPTEARINELIDGRVEELHRDRIPPERLRSEHVTNVYEKLILDMCKELYRELRPADPTVSFRTITHDKRPLVFYNPPDALRCMKDYLRAKVRRILNEEQLALQQQHQHQHHQHQQLLLHHHQLQQQQQQQQQQQPSHVQLQQHHQLLHHCATMPFLFANGGNASRRKRDQVDEILAQEMHDDDARWTNFDREEIEVKDRITDVLLKSLLTEALHDMAEASRCKAKVGGKVMAVAPQESAM